MNEIVKAAPTASLPDMVRYAEHLANANLLPSQYRKQPSNVLYAMEYGRTLGITPLAAITGIHVIEGKPSASAALIGALVRQAGHKLRVRGNGLSATAQIIRADDPDFTYEVTWELHSNSRGNPSAEDAGLLKKDIWKKYGAAMLKARAISQVARDACEEVLFGLHYTPEELGAYVDQDGLPVEAPVTPLRSVQTGTAVIDPGVFVPHPEGQQAADKAAAATWRGPVRDLWKEATAGQFIRSGVLAPDTGEPSELGAYLTRRLEVLPETAPAATESVVVDAEVVADGKPDEYTTAVDELRAAALEAGVADTLEQDFAQSYGVTIDLAKVEAIREMTALLKGAAA